MTPPPSVSKTDEATLEFLVEQLTNQALNGEIPSIDDLVRKHPQHADQLRELLPTIQMMCHWGTGGRADAVLDGSAPGTASFDSATSPRQLGDFRIIREIGRGGMGIVFEAHQISLARRIALKVLPFASLLDERQLKRFRNEARAAAMLKHPNIVSVYSVGCERGVHYYAMEFVEGASLAEIISDLEKDPSKAAGRSAVQSQRKHTTRQRRSRG